MWQKFRLRMVFDVELCGGVPREKDKLEAWVNMRTATPAAFQKLVTSPLGPDGKEPRSLEAVAAEQQATRLPLPSEEEGLDEEAAAKLKQEELERSWVGFSADDKGLFVRGGNLRAHLKQCAEALGPIVKSERCAKELGLPKGVTWFKGKIIKYLYVVEDRLYLVRDGRVLTEPDGHRDATLSVVTPMGQRQCLKRVDYVEPGTLLDATIMWMNTPDLDDRHMKLLFEYGCVQGFGQDRSLQYGRYSYELVALED